MPIIMSSLSHSSWSSDDDLLPSLTQFDQISNDLASYVQDQSPGNIKPEPTSPTAPPRTPPKRTSKHDGETADQYSERARNDVERAREKALAGFPNDEKRPRTRQACDRCRYRRLACDSEPEGCNACKNADMKCHMTDRVTGETLVRGEAKRLRRNIVTLEQRIKVLEEENQLLRPYADAYHRWQAPQYQDNQGLQWHDLDTTAIYHQDQDQDQFK